ncbi:MAG TPA: c-type cytochrome [Vicinamibacterales bacterium]|nr:c-type cytochrome [Vicinamibacterales bacterium]
MLQRTGQLTCWALAALLCAVVVTLGAQEKPASGGQRPDDGWTVPSGASEEKNPLTVTPQTLVAGRALFQKNCRRCHGPKGIGDGPDADPDYMADMDLTNPKRAERNPDGVVFHKVWNGRQKPKMPAFKEELTKEQVWTIVSYVQTLRKPASD